jgi:CheY-like chemotaxis protein
VRYLQDGQACAIDTRIIDWDTRRHSPYLRTTWPDEVQYVSFRKFERIRLQMFCTVLWPGNVTTTEEIRDLSIGGCGVQATRPSEEGDVLMLSFELADGTHIQGISAVVRNVRDANGRYFLGCEFEDGQDYAESNIAFYVTSTLERRNAASGSERPMQRVLIVDSDIDTAIRLKQNFEQQGCEAVLAHNTVDAMYRLRMSPPAAMIISEELHDLSGAAVCGIIKRNADFEALPVYVYGGHDEGLADLAKRAGAKGYFPPTISMVPDLAFDVARDLAKAAGHRM